MTNLPAMEKLQILVLLLLSLAGCVEVIKLDTGRGQGQVTIYAQLNNSLTYDQRVRVALTQDDFSRPADVWHAQVWVEREDGFTFPYSYVQSEGVYLPVNPYSGVPGCSYRLLVTFDEKTYQSNYQQMPLHTAVDEPKFDFSVAEQITDGISFQEWTMRVFVDSELPNEANNLFIKRDLLVVYQQREIILPVQSFPFYTPRPCWVIEFATGDNVKLFNSQDIPSQIIPDQTVGVLPLDAQFNAVRGFGILQSSITQEAYDYWQKVDKVSNRVGSIFEVPPAPIRGNIANTDTPQDMALGFFEVAKVDTVGRRVLLDDIPIFMPLNTDIVDCSFVTFAQLQAIPAGCFQCLEDDLGLDRACYDCDVIPKSTRELPSYLE